MDNIEKKLYQDLNEDITIPEKCEEVIRESLKTKRKHYSLIKVVSTACASLMITAGVVYAGTKVAETIWKKPERVVGDLESSITEEEMKGIMSENEAKSKAENLLKKFDYNEEKIETIKLEKDTFDSEISWIAETNSNISITFDAYDKEKGALYLFNGDCLKKNIENYHTTKEDAEKTARDLCEKFGYDLSEYDYVEVSANLENEKEAYIWYVNFYKEYDGLVDKFNSIDIAFVPEINEIYYFIVEEEKFENNPVEITEEQAKETVLEAERKTGISYEVKNTEIELGIVEMNGGAYLRTTDYEQFCEQSKLNYPEEQYIEYLTEKRIRKAWKVMIEYDVPINDTFNENFNNQDLGYIYYIDATTGEIIGGEEYNKPIISK